MKNISFKAICLSNGSWILGDLIHGEHGELYILGEHPNEHGDKKYALVYMPSVCQLTGLKDMDGKEVWEHDIVEDVTANMSLEVAWSTESCCYVLLDRQGGQIGNCIVGKQLENCRIKENKFDKGCDWWWH